MMKHQIEWIKYKMKHLSNLYLWSVKIAKIVLYKKGSKQIVNNYRYISLFFLNAVKSLKKTFQFTIQISWRKWSCVNISQVFGLQPLVNICYYQLYKASINLFDCNLPVNVMYKAFVRVNLIHMVIKWTYLWNNMHWNKSFTSQIDKKLLGK